MMSIFSKCYCRKNVGAFRTAGTALVILGLGLLAAGISVIVAFIVMRRNNIGRIESMLPAWESSDSPHGWRQFQQLNAYAFLTPGNPQDLASGNCFNITIRLDPSSCPYNVYLDEGARLQAVKQVALCGAVPYSAFVSCDLRVSFHLTQGGANTTLVALPDLDSAGYKPVRIDMTGIRGPQLCEGRRRCGGPSEEECAGKCGATFGGTLDCPAFACSANATVSELAVKVASKSGVYVLDDTGPIFSAGGAGANVLPQGYSWDWYPEPSGKAPRWQYDGLAFLTAPASLRLTLRSSADPWVTYLAVTRGSGYFEKPMIVDGSIWMAVGCASLVAGALSIAVSFVVDPEEPSGCCPEPPGGPASGPMPGSAAPSQLPMQTYPFSTARPECDPEAASRPEPGPAAAAAAGACQRWPPPLPGTPLYRYSLEQQPPLQEQPLDRDLDQLPPLQPPLPGALDQLPPLQEQPLDRALDQLPPLQPPLQRALDQLPPLQQPLHRALDQLPPLQEQPLQRALDQLPPLQPPLQRALDQLPPLQPPLQRALDQLLPLQQQPQKND